MNIIALLIKFLEIICSANPILIKLYSLYYENLVEREIELAKISSNDKVLCIGGGFVPSTALKIAKINSYAHCYIKSATVKKLCFNSDTYLIK